MAFLNRFPSDGNLRFAAHENFWQDFLAGELDEDAFVAFFETTKDGARFYTEEELLAWQDAVIGENQKNCKELLDTL